MTQTAEDFRKALLQRLREAEEAGRAYLDVRSGDLHRQVGGWPGAGHQLPVCCEVMLSVSEIGDEVRAEPPSGQGASLVVRYRLPKR